MSGSQQLLLGGKKAEEAVFVEDVFSTWLYTGNGTTNPIVNGIDLAGKGGLVWIKARTGTRNHRLVDTARGAGNFLSSDTTSAQTFGPTLTSFNSTGFTLASGDAGSNGIEPYVSWTFREQPKFFDVVTFTSNSTGGATFNHNLESVPGCVIIKCTSAAESWWVWHRTFTSTQYMVLNATSAVASASPTLTASSTQVTLGNGWLVGSSQTYVAYLFAHNAGGFGLSGTDNVVSCGSFVFSGSATVNLGFEPQWIMYKNTSNADNWNVFDNMRGLSMTNDRALRANTSGSEIDFDYIDPTATGFTVKDGSNGATYIYIAIRRPMKVPTTGTSVFAPVTYTGNGSTTRTVNTTITPDAAWFFHRDTANGQYWYDRLRGNNRFLRPNETSAETSFGSTGAAWGFDVQNAVYLNGSADYINGSSALNGLWALKRAPGFFDEVCYTGTGSARTVVHNLTVVPELMIVKTRDGIFGANWGVYVASLGATNNLWLNLTNAADTFGNVFWNSTAPTASVFSVGTNATTNYSGSPYVAYLFASCPGVSKVGSYTGNGDPVGTTGAGVTQDVNCGFTGGARFVLIKRTNAADNWYVWDTARGITSTTEPDLRLNSTAAESSGLNSVNPLSSGFTVRQNAGTNVNAAGQTYIFLAIA